MVNRFWLAFFAVGLTGCASLSSSISNGNFQYASSDVSVSPFGSNYQITTLLNVAGQRVKAQTYASDCEKDLGTLRIEGKDYFDRPMLNVAKGGNKKEDEIFKYMCDKGLPVAYQREDQLSESDKQRRNQAVMNYLIQTMPSQRPVYVAPPVPTPQRNQDVKCITTNYSGGAYTNCQPQ